MPAANPVLQAIAARSSIRSFTSEPVPREAVETMFRAAMAAPSAKNVRPWRFLATADAAVMNALADGLPNAPMLRASPLAVMVGADMVVAEAGTPGYDYWIQDCSAATQNFLLAAEALGYGAVWLGITPISERIAHVRRVLALPETVRPLCLIAVGRPRGPGVPKDKFDSANIHWEKW